MLKICPDQGVTFCAGYGHNFRGVQLLWGNVAFLHVSDSPLFQKIWNFFPNSPFQQNPKIFRFSNSKISDDLFLVIDSKFRISPYLQNFYVFFIGNSVFFIPKLHNVIGVTINKTMCQSSVQQKLNKSWIWSEIFNYIIFCSLINILSFQ